MTSNLKFIMRTFIFLANLQFSFQGSQKKYVRVPISRKATEVGFQFPTRIVGKMVLDTAMVSEFVGIQVYLFYTNKMSSEDATLKSCWISGNI